MREVNNTNIFTMTATERNKYCSLIVATATMHCHQASARAVPVVGLISTADSRTDRLRALSTASFHTNKCRLE